eukprot:1148441-Pelagomonas_calceolata.AAC.3
MCRQHEGRLALRTGQQIIAQRALETSFHALGLQLFLTTGKYALPSGVAQGYPRGSIEYIKFTQAETLRQNTGDIIVLMRDHLASKLLHKQEPSI